MGCCRAKTGFLRTVSSWRIFSLFKIESDLVETLIGNVIIVIIKIAAVDDSIDRVAVGAKAACTLDFANSFEAEPVPYLTGCNVGLVYQVEDGVCVTLIETAN